MKIMAIAVSKRKGTRKDCVEEALLVKEHGIQGDAHAGAWHRQVSFLAVESIEKAKAAGLSVGFGDFAENIATEGIDWVNVPVAAGSGWANRPWWKSPRLARNATKNAQSIIRPETASCRAKAYLPE